MGTENAIYDNQKRIYLEGMAFQIYLYMINHPLDINENPFLTKKEDLQYHLGILLKNGLIEKSGTGLYVIKDEYVLEQLLGYFLRRNNESKRRYIFYFAFMMSGLAIFVVYLLILPKTSFTTEVYALGFALFSLAALTKEAVVIKRNMIMLKMLKQ